MSSLGPLKDTAAAAAAAAVDAVDVVGVVDVVVDTAADFSPPCSRGGCCVCFLCLHFTE